MSKIIYKIICSIIITIKITVRASSLETGKSTPVTTTNEYNDGPQTMTTFGDAIEGRAKMPKGMQKAT